MPSPNDHQPRPKWQTFGGTALVAVAILFVVARWFLARSAVVVVFAGGTAEAPRVVAGSIQPDRTTPDSRHARAKQELLVFAPAKDDPVGQLTVTGAASAAGARGTMVWFQVQGRPFLVDVARGRTLLRTRDLEDQHAPLAGGFEVSSAAHTEFSQAYHPATGSLVVKASNRLEYLLGADGSLVPWKDWVADHPSGELPACRGGRSKICGVDVCVKAIPDPGGGEKLSIAKATSKDSFFGPELLGDGCIDRLTPQGAFVVTHRAKPGRKAPRDRISAIAPDGSTTWTVTLDELFGHRELQSHHVGVGDGVVVVGAVIKHWLRGATAIVASVKADGTVRPAAAE